jgi:hypothetical protein
MIGTTSHSAGQHSMLRDARLAWPLTGTPANPTGKPEPERRT